MSLRSTTKTAGDVGTYTKRVFGDEAGVQITDADIYRWINQAQWEICQRNKVVKKAATTDIVAAQADYTLADLDILDIESIKYNGGLLPGQEMAQAQETINNATGGTGISTGMIAPVLWYRWDATLTLWPTPVIAITDGLVIYYTETPTDVTKDADVLSVPDKYYEAVLNFVLHQAYLLDEAFNEAELMKQHFEQALNFRNEEERSAGQITYPKITIVE